MADSPRLTLLAALAAAALPLMAAPSMAQQRPAAFVDAATVVPNLIVEMRYLTPHNFVGQPIDGYEKPICYLTRPAADALAKVARELEPKGLVVKAFDCYRPTRAVAHFVRWARRTDDIARKDIREGDYVVVEKAGDVIPRVVAPILSRRTDDSRPWQMPTTCPRCESTLQRPEEIGRAHV